MPGAFALPSHLKAQWMLGAQQLKARTSSRDTCQGLLCFRIHVSLTPLGSMSHSFSATHAQALPILPTMCSQFLHASAALKLSNCPESPVRLRVQHGPVSSCTADEKDSGYRHWPYKDLQHWKVARREWSLQSLPEPPASPSQTGDAYSVEHLIEAADSGAII